MIDTPILKNTLSYIAGFIFIAAIAIYLYLLIEDNRQKTNHDTEETFWIYLFLVLLVLGFFFSYYFISKSTNRIIDMQENFKSRGHLKFVGKNPRIPVRGGGPLRNSIV